MALQHLRSSTAHKRPIPTVMSAGQIAINTNEASPALFFKDSNGDLVKVGPVHIGTDAPNSSPASVAATALVTGTVYQILTVGDSDFTLVGASANTVGTIFTATGTTTGTGTVSGQQGVEKGEMWLDTTGGTYVLKIYDGTDWRSESGTFVDVSGDTMTGALLLDNAASASAPDLSFDGDADTGVYSPGANQVAIATGGNGRVFIDSSGRLLVGTSTSIDSASTLQVKNGFINLYHGNSASGSGYGIRFSTDGGATGRTHAQISLLQTAAAGGSLLFSTTADGASSPTERMRIDSSGNVGIGASPVNSTNYVNLALSDTNGGLITFMQGATQSADIIGGSGLFLRTLDASPITFRTNGSNERMRIDSSGRVGVGTSTPTNILHVAGTSSTPAIFDRTDTTGIFIGLKDSASQTFIGNTNGVFSIQTPGSSYSDKLIVTSLGLVGIGTTSPTGQLDVAGSLGTFRVGTSGAEVFFTRNENNDIRANGGSSAAVSIGGQSHVRFQTGSGFDERARIDSSGRLLVGTSTSTTGASSQYAKLQIIGNNSSAADRGAIVNLGHSAGATSITTDELIGQFLFTDNAAGEYGFISCLADGNAGSGDYPGRLVFSTTADGSSSPTERMRLDSSGNVGLGKSSDLFYRLTFQEGASDANRIGWVSTSGNRKASIDCGNTAAIVFNTGISDSERARIDSSGRLLVGTSSAFGATTSELLQVANSNGGKISLLRNDASIASGNEVGVITWYSADGNTQPVASVACVADGDHATNDKPGRLVFSTTADGASSPTERLRIANNGLIDSFCAGSAYVVRTATGAGTSGELFHGLYSATAGGTGGTSCIKIYTNGNIQNVNNSYGSLSDLKLKENIVDANSQWDDLKALQVRNYNLKEGQTHTQIGLIAQEVELVSAGLVSESPDFDEDGNDLGTVTKSVKYSVLYMKAVKALQEAMERIETLEASNADLLARVSALEAS